MPALASFKPRAGAMLVALSLVLAGCAVHTPYQQPAVDLPATWQAGNGPDMLAVAVPDQAQWWHQFNDPLLDRWVADVLDRNADLATASLNVRRARLQAGLSADAMRPTVSSSANSSLRRELDDGGQSRQSSASLGLSYEWDLWGRLSSENAADRWEAEATEADREAARQSLVVTTISLYWQAGYLNQRVAASEANLASARRLRDIVTVQRNAGGASALDVAEITRSLASLEATHAQLRQEREENLRALALLRDAPPSTDLLVPDALPQAALPDLQPGLPASLLARRPDVQATELRLRQSLASADATRADYYPRLSLTGSLGTSSNALLDLLANPIGTLGAGLTLPFLQVTEMRLNRQLADATTEQAVINFRQTLYQALAEVDNALSAQTRYTTETRQRDIALDAARETERLQQVRYDAGAVELKDWLDAQDSRRSSETALWEAQLNQRINLLKLWQALGGDPGNAEAAAAASTAPATSAAVQAG